MNREALKTKADFIRQEIIRVAVKNNAGHIAPSLSCVDILVALYYDVMGVADKLIFSKAHGCYGIYAILADKRIMPKEKWENFDLPGCLERMPEYGIEAGCGALGHGLPMAVGLAFGNKLQGHHGHVFCIMGDGETQEGTTWESIQFALHHKLNNLTVIVDDNGLQAMDFRIKIIDIELNLVIQSLGNWEFSSGHNILELCDVLYIIDKHQPTFIFADTTKGYGLKCAEDKPMWHFRVPKGEELKCLDNVL